jgi:hypothetical protein
MLGLTVMFIALSLLSREPLCASEVVRHIRRNTYFAQVARLRSVFQRRRLTARNVSGHQAFQLWPAASAA